MEPTPLLDCGLGPGWHGAATRSLHRARAASCPLATLATQWRGHQHSDNTSGWPHALWPYSDYLRTQKLFRKHLVTCVDVLPPCGQCVAAAGVLQGSVLARSQDCGPAPARHGSSTQPWPPSWPPQPQLQLTTLTRIQIVATLTFRLIVYVSSFNADTTPCTNHGLYKIMLPKPLPRACYILIFFIFYFCSVRRTKSWLTISQLHIAIL